jgi:flagellar biosynthesis regulator FlbT
MNELHRLAESVKDQDLIAELERLDELVAALKHYGRSDDYRDLIDWILRRFGH